MAGDMGSKSTVGATRYGLGLLARHAGDTTLAIALHVDALELYLLPWFGRRLLKVPPGPDAATG